MPVADVFCVFFEEAACGVLAFLPAVSVKEGGRRFFEVSVAIALAALVLGQGARALGGGLAGTERAVALGGAGLSLGLGLVALRVLRGTGFDRARWWLGAAALAALLALGAEAMGAAPQGAALASSTLGRSALLLASMACGAALTGSVLLAMILGHFYLVIPRLSIDPLRKLTNGYLVSVIARIAIAALVVSLAWNVEAKPGRSVFLEEAALLLPRALFGLLGALVLCLLARGTVTIKSTQSATGILYGATVFVVTGELIASWLALEAGLPL
ncbi:hypothetical protein HY251_03565 [bacterium]|nr:hypothetical protein [bacterium]